MELVIPSTYAADERDPKLRVHKYGMLARAASIFSIDKITIYKDTDEKIDEGRSADLMRKHLEYAECPPYLRKALIPFDDDLKYANILPALQIPSHGYKKRFREAVVTEVEDGRCTLNAGLASDLTVYDDLEEGERVTVKVTGRTEAVVIDTGDVPGYWTYSVQNRRDRLQDVIDEEKTVVGTSAHGDDYRETGIDAAPDDTQLVFGSAWRGLPDMIGRGDVQKKQFDHMIDYIPTQQTKTVRTEEAVIICISRFLQ